MSGPPFSPCHGVAQRGKMPRAPMPAAAEIGRLAGDGGDDADMARQDHPRERVLEIKDFGRWGRWGR